MSRSRAASAAAYPLTARAAAPSTGARVPECIESWPEVRYRNYGYDHIVHLHSRCGSSALCAVSTDVNPSAIDVVVPAREHVEVLTFRGSPARQFTPRVSCRFRR